MSRNQKQTLIKSMCAALSTTGGYIAVALTLVIIAVIASIFHVNWSERIAIVGLVILFSLIMGKRGSNAV
ncbi:MAG TPA: hypothetical protein VG649_07955 [Candidatus Angelobacter sp.]|nr:hypothetical protein [Candidatus Angelobacter sp.]